ncbi:hypothetical protein HORIV_20910 [Vreelandella olivaria]|uniref:Secreted protein n=1 Tax=Vreelandella olivaria TaxID=390919 RepID=A0ABN5WXG9_9GAMM|nr:hypothetical protein HORIV_20910 [Halomonas olivaria]
MGKVAFEQLLELLLVQLFYVVGVLVAGFFAVFVLVGAGDNQQTAGAQYPLDLFHHRFVAVVVLNGFKTHHHVHAGVGQGMAAQSPCR